jgi:hypothetical protein
MDQINGRVSYSEAKALFQRLLPVYEQCLTD